MNEKSPTVVMLTGSTGFIGRYLLSDKSNSCVFRVVSVRDQQPEDLDFHGVDTVLHLAGLAHQMKKVPDHFYFDSNTKMTARLADAAKAAKVPHFVFVSTIKAFGERGDVVFSENTACHPVNDPYGESKLQAEQYLRSIEDGSFKVAIVRPPLVYGPEVKGNLIRFLQLADSPWPLPFAGIHNRRTLVSLFNLTALLMRIIDTKAAGLFLASDLKPFSTTFLMETLRDGLGRPRRLFRLPASVIRLLHWWRPDLAMRLYGSLEMDNTETCRHLAFTPPQDTRTGLLNMAQWYKNAQNSHPL